MASYQVLPASTFFEDIGKGVGGMAGNYLNKRTMLSEEEKEEKKQKKINVFLDSLGDEYEKETIKFDKYGNPIVSVKKKEEKKEKVQDPINLIKDALIFDANIPEVGKNMGMQPTAQGFPMAGGGGVLPSSAGGEYDPSQLETINTPDYSGMVRQALIDKAHPGIPKDKALNNIFGIKEEKLKEVIPPEFENKIADIFSSSQDVENPREEIKKLIPLYSGNKEALDRIKLLLSLFPEE